MSYKKLLLIPLVAIILIIFYIFVLTKPSNSRNWEVGHEIPVRITTNNNQITVHELRDFQYSPGKLENPRRTDRTFDINKLKKVWFLFEPFGSSKAVAHTFFVFDFEDQPPVAVSVEARREKNERYDAWVGLFNRYELIYVWGTEMDEVIRRVIVDKEKLYMYPLNISAEGAKKLFIQMSQTTHELESNPRFYNTIVSNCTNELAKSANKVKPGAIPFHYALFMPGYSIELLSKLNYISWNGSLEELKHRYYISDKVKELYTDPDFSNKLRQSLE